MSALGTDPRPSIVLPRELVPVPLAIALGAVMALGLLIYLLAHRQAAEDGQGKPQGIAQSSPPQLVIPLAPSIQPPPVMIIRSVAPARPRPEPRPAPSFVPMRYAEPPRQLEADPEPESEARRRRQAAGGLGMPLVIDLTKGVGGTNEPRIEGEGSPERRQPEDEAASATQIRNRGAMIPQGAIIAAVLETPLNSDRPGLARAIVSQDARSFDGSRVLIPRGSRLIGEFKADISPGLRRIPVMWTRLIRPDGVAIRIRSPGADALGGAGIGGRVNSHFGQRLLGAVLQSALTIGVNVVSALPAKNGSPVYVGLPGQAQQLGEQLVPKVDRPPTVQVREGAEISVLVARDLDFTGTPPVR